MFEQDYLVRMLVALAHAMRRSMERASGEHDTHAGAEMLDHAVGEAVDLDREVFLNLAPESISSILMVTGAHPQLIGFVARSLLLSGHYYTQAGNPELGELRRAQAYALSNSFDLGLSEDDITDEALQAFLDDFDDSTSDVS